MIGGSIITFSLAAALFALLFAMILTKRILKADPGNPEMQKISDATRDGAMT